MASENTPAIFVEDVTKTYNAGVEALKKVSLSVKEGEFFGLLGPNGAGKSTLIGILSGLVLKSGGKVEICGVSVDRNPDKAKSFIGLVPQEFNFNWFETVEDIILNQAGYYGIPRHEAFTKATELIENLGLSDKRTTQAMKLSGGMKRRLMIARALIHEPRVLLLDEPTAGVDVELRRGMWDFLRELNANGTTIILTTHYLEEAEQLCNEIAIINHGEIIRKGSVKSLLTDLHAVTLLIDTAEPIRLAEMELLRSYPLKKADDSTLELTLTRDQTANDALRKISSIGLQIVNIRNPGSRLEEVFINLIEKK
ncbi:MAG: ABC transporter ATP-binding protein [Candidatus Pacebacteria bacterium]|nr:ABC transporter ATP-binding protein [Candidatus Paceibacterota bacterium]